MEKETVLIILMVIWTVINIVWYGILKEREGRVMGTLSMVDHLCDSLARSFGVDLTKANAGNCEEGILAVGDKKDTPDDYEYSGVLHTFKRNGKKRERPIMVYQFRNKTCYFEYDENGKKVALNHREAKSAIEKVLKGEKVDNYRKYEIEQK